VLETSPLLQAHLALEKTESVFSNRRMSLKGTGKARKRMAPFLIDLGKSLAASGKSFAG
jgi:hypothetical protein